MRATVRGVMTTNVAVAGTDTPSTDMAAALRDCRVSAFPVPGGHGTVIGVASETSLLAREALDGTVPGRIAGMPHRREQARAGGITAAGLMPEPALAIGPGAAAAGAAGPVHARRVKRLPLVTGEGKLIGIISRPGVLSVYGRPDEGTGRGITADVIPGSLLAGLALVTVTVTNGAAAIEGTPETVRIGRDLIEAARHIEGVVAVRDGLSCPQPARGIWPAV